MKFKKWGIPSALKYKRIGMVIVFLALFRRNKKAHNHAVFKKWANTMNSERAEIKMCMNMTKENKMCRIIQK